MKKEDNPQSGLSGTAAAADLLTDSLLRNYAANPDGADDADFLAEVEAAIDADEGGHPEFATTEATRLPRPKEKQKRGTRLGWAAGIAAALMAGFAGLALNLHSPAVPENPPQLIAKTATDSADASIESQRVARVKRRPTVSASSAVSSPEYHATLTGPALPAQRSAHALSDVAAAAGPRNGTHPANPRREYLLDESLVNPVPSSGFGMTFGMKTNRAEMAFPIENSAARYDILTDNRWKSPFREPLSTFSIDVDTASWTNIRGMLERGVSPARIPKDAVRIEEMINYFDWNYPQPAGRHPFGYAVESATCPWEEDNRLLRVAIQAKDLRRGQRPPANLVFLLDVSGSMNQPDKLPLVQKAISILVEELDEDDCVSIVVYAGSEGLALPPTRGHRQRDILTAVNRLQAGGSTNGGAGIELAYRMAAKNFIPEGVNRVILCTDGDFNVGLTGKESLVELVENRAKRDRVFLSVCGFGDDNLNDAMLEGITNKGNGAYYYIDRFAEARKVFLRDLSGTLVTLAKDVKIQIEFNPGQVKAYRLIGYANRQLRDRDFEDDRVDAGEIGAGHSVTAFYEIVPAGAEKDPTEMTSNLRYQQDRVPEPPPVPKRRVVPSRELALLKLRYKEPDADVSQYVDQTVMPNDRDWRKASADFRFAAAVALFGLKLRDHESARHTELADIIAIAGKAIGKDPHGYREEFVKLLKRVEDR